MKQLKVIVTGVGRSGTVYFSRFLSSIGLMCGHESIFTPAGFEEAFNRLKNYEKINTSLVSNKTEQNWFKAKDQVAESSYMAVPFIDDSLFEKTKIIHLVRNPIKVISSTHIDANFFDPKQASQLNYMNFVLRHLPQLSCVENRLQKNVMYYILWNQMVETKAANRQYIRHRIEDGITKELFEFLEIEPVENYHKKNENSWNIRKRDLNCEEMPNYLFCDLFELMNNYGYKISKSLI